MAVRLEVRGNFTAADDGRERIAAGGAPAPIGALLPTGVAFADSTRDVPPEALLPAERAALGRAAERRLREFAAGRSCARRALAALGAPEAAILRGPRREPLWPPGVVGSITHCRGYCAAAVADAGRFAALGIDAEPHEPLPEGVLQRIALDEEHDWIAERADAVCWDRLLFCVKEAVFKAWYPLAGRWLGFEDARVRFAPERGAFRADLAYPTAPAGQPGPTTIAGRFTVGDELAVVAIAVERGSGGTRLD
jgi:4'-phosphopantetheinyl transferase EntD